MTAPAARRRRVVAASLLVAAGLLPWLVSVSGIRGAGYWTGLFADGYVLALYAVGYSILLGTVRLLNLGYAAIYGGAAYVTGILVVRLDVPFLAAALIGMASATALSAGFGWVASRTRGVYFSMVTLAVGIAILAVVNSPGMISITGAGDGLRGVAIPALMDSRRNPLAAAWICLGVLVAGAALARWFLSIPLGRATSAVGQNENRAETLGYRTGMAKVAVSAVSGLLGAVAGVLSLGVNQGVTPAALTIEHTAVAILLTLIGGVGSIAGPAVAAVGLVFLEDRLVAQLGDIWVLAYCLVAIVVLLAAPNGIPEAIRNRRKR